MDRIYISATGQHAGKTTISLGLYRLFEKLGKSIAYIKPVGQRSLEYEGHSVDEDAILFREHLKCNTPVEALTAVTVPRGFTEKYVFNRNRGQIYDDIDKAMLKLDESLDVTIIEGTGHAGVGSVFDASNAAVACLLGAKAVIISGGGIGRCLDEIALNKALFNQENVRLLGAIINKVLPEKYEKVDRAVRQGLTNMGVECLGVIPFESDLTFPTVEQLVEEGHIELLASDEDSLQNHVENNFIAAAHPEFLLSKLKEQTLLIVPAVCAEKILPETLSHLDENGQIGKISCVLFTDAFKPSDKLLDLLRRHGLPVLATDKHTFKIAAKLGNMIVKISPHDPHKIENACKLMEKHLDLDKILRGLEDD